MKGISVEIIGGVVLALVGVTVMIALFTDLSPVDSDSGFCSVYKGLSPSLPDSVTPSVAGCKEGPEIEYKKVRTSDPDRIALKVGVGAQECWEEYRGYDVGFKRCKAWNIQDLSGTVTESDVTTKLSDNGICPDLIENSPCGSGDDIRFDMSSISSGSFVIVGYNSSGSDSFVEVK
jgi:hypothetical protein